MRKRTHQAALTAVGAVIGAGFASGREIVSFFSQYGRMSWLGIGTAVAVIFAMAMGCLHAPGIAGMPASWKGRWRGRVWRGMFGMLMLATGGAMLAGGGEVIALVHPGRLAWAAGTGATLLLSVMMARHGLGGSAWVSGIMAGILLLLLGIGSTLPVQPAMVHDANPARSILQGACYAGFNMALASPGLAEASAGLNDREKRRCALLMTGMLAALLALGNGVMLRRGADQRYAMPLLQMSLHLGVLGRGLCCGGMYLAVLTTACAALRGLWLLLPQKRWARIAAVGGMFLCAMTGFTGMVEVVYPVLGGGCLVLLVAAWGTKIEKNA